MIHAFFSLDLVLPGTLKARRTLLVCFFFSGLACSTRQRLTRFRRCCMLSCMVYAQQSRRFGKKRHFGVAAYAPPPVLAECCGRNKAEAEAEGYFMPVGWQRRGGRGRGRPLLSTDGVLSLRGKWSSWFSPFSFLRAFPTVLSI